MHGKTTIKIEIRVELIEFGHGWSVKDAVCKYDRQGKGRIRHKEVLRKVLYWIRC